MLTFTAVVLDVFMVFGGDWALPSAIMAAITAVLALAALAIPRLCCGGGPARELASSVRSIRRSEVSMVVEQHDQ
ncbi:MAG TPA: hypothetical protein VG125_21340 [Pirellulales bacterium]|nr:hypothetical protein [Pirellulales bacterium]